MKYRKDSDDRLQKKRRTAGALPDDAASLASTAAPDANGIRSTGGATVSDATEVFTADSASGDWNDRQSCLPVPSTGTLSMLNGPLSNVLMAKPPPTSAEAAEPTIAEDSTLPVRRVAREVAHMLPAKCRGARTEAGPSP